MNFNLKNKSNDTLIADLKAMVVEERRLQTQILHYLLEVEERKLYLEKGCPHLFDFVTKELGYSEPAASRRIQAMRLMKEVPEVEEKLDSELRELRRKRKTLSGSSKNPDKVFEQESLTPAPESGMLSRNRHIPQAIRDKIWMRDHGECQYQDPVSGKTCGSRHGLQLDHIQPYSAGGEHVPENLRLLCGAHNRFRAEQKHI